MSIKKKQSEKSQIIKKAIAEGERIFMKNNPNLAMKDGSFPKAGPDMPAKYNKEANRTEKQVVKTRLKQWKDKQPKLMDKLLRFNIRKKI